MKVKADQFTSTNTQSLESSRTLPGQPPLSLVADEIGLKGRIAPSVVRKRSVWPSGARRRRLRRPGRSWQTSLGEEL